MFKLLKRMLTSEDKEKAPPEEESEQEQQEVEVEEEIEEEPPPPPPENIEVPWKIAASVYNYDVATKKIFADLKEFLYETEVKKKTLWETAESFASMKEETKKKIMAVYKEKLNIPDDIIYNFEEPEATGRSAFLKRKKE